MGATEERVRERSLKVWEIMRESPSKMKSWIPMSLAIESRLQKLLLPYQAPQVNYLPDKPGLKMLTTMHSFSLTSYKLLFSIFTSTSFAFISRRIPFVQFDVLNNNTLWVHKAAVNLTCVTRGEPHWSIWRAQEYIMALRAQRHSEGHP